MKKWISFLALSSVLVLGACGNADEEPEVHDDNTGMIEDNNEEEGMTEEDTDLTDEETEDPDAIGEDTEDGDDQASSDMVAVDLIDANGESVGSAELTEEDEGVTVKVVAEGLPEGSHGFHFHETGKCELPDFESAGSHFNPTDTEHGLDNESGPHAGDLPNLVVEEDGTVDEEILAENVTLKEGEENSLFQEGGTALVIHSDEDDGVSQPAGDAGDRIVCGVIE